MAARQFALILFTAFLGMGCSQGLQRDNVECEHYTICLLNRHTFQNAIIIGLVDISGDTVFAISDKPGDSVQSQPARMVVDTLAMDRQYNLRLRKLDPTSKLEVDSRYHIPIEVRIGGRRFWSNDRTISADSMMFGRETLYLVENAIGLLVLTCEPYQPR